MLYLLTFGFFIGYLAFLATVAWFFITRFLAPRIDASRGEALIIFYCTLIVSFIFLIIVNHYTGFLASFYRFFDETFFNGQYTRRLP